MLHFLSLVAIVTAIIVFLRWYSYRYLKSSIIGRRRWDLNICCGTTDVGGVNVDIVRHADVPNFILVDNIYRLPFPDGAFGTVLCSHTIEHVENPRRFDRELRRAGRNVVYIIPPAWDLAAAFNIWEHRWIFLTVRKIHYRLPRRVVRICSGNSRTVARPDKTALTTIRKTIALERRMLNDALQRGGDRHDWRQPHRLRKRYRKAANLSCMRRFSASLSGIITSACWPRQS